MILKQNVNLGWRTNRVSPPPGPQNVSQVSQTFKGELFISKWLWLPWFRNSWTYYCWN